jgi:3-hydroxyisobutyrate dehydrogenase-like beta-hydroxyacid dehydrogenase
MNAPPIQRIAIIGFGEVGGIFGRDFSQAGLNVAVTDILLRDPASRDKMLQKARNASVCAHDAYPEAICDADLVISAVTSSSSVSAATEAARFLQRGQLYLDINSVSPGKKREIAGIVGGTNATFVEAAVMAPVSPQRLRVPMLLGGPEAPEAAERLRAIGMKAKAVNDRVGVASAIKMCRSVLIKGLEALTVECLFAARRYGAEEEVLASLESSYPSMGWSNQLPNYLVSRVAQHGRRRAAEMREVAEALKDVELDPRMALATAALQDWLVDEMVEARLACEDRSFSWTELADRIYAQSKINAQEEPKEEIDNRAMKGSTFGR